MEKPLSKEDQEEIKLARLFESMVATEAWKRYIDVISKKSGEYMSNLLKETSTREEDLIQKGALKGLHYCLSLPGVTIASASDLLARAGRTTEDGDDE